MGAHSKLYLEIEKTDGGYNIINGFDLAHENHVVKDRRELSVILHMFLNLLDHEDIQYASKHYEAILRND